MSKTLSEGGRDLQLTVLNTLMETVRRGGDLAGIIQTESGDGQVDLLDTSLFHFGDGTKPCQAEFYFRPASEDPEGGQIFCAVITLLRDIPYEQVPELALALSILNFYLETGCFALNKPADLLVYKNTGSFSGEITEEALVQECLLFVENTLKVAVKYHETVLALADGTLSLNDFMDMIEE